MSNTSGPSCVRSGLSCSRSPGIQGCLQSSEDRQRLDARELRHSFVSLMSNSGVPVEEIARLAGHANTRTTVVVYRRELRPVLTTGAEAMDRLFQSPPAQTVSTPGAQQ